MNLNIDLMVTWTSAMNLSSIRFGKGQAFFDLERGMLFILKMAKLVTP